jgi:hypothetical protein
MCIGIYLRFLADRYTSVDVASNWVSAIYQSQKFQSRLPTE